MDGGLSVPDVGEVSVERQGGRRHRRRAAPASGSAASSPPQFLVLAAGGIVVVPGVASASPRGRRPSISSNTCRAVASGGR